MTSAALLSDLPVAIATNTSRLRDAVGGLIGYDHAVVAASTHHDPVPRGVVNGGRFPDLSLVFVAYATPVHVVAPPATTQVVLVDPLRAMEVVVEGRRHTMTTPFVLSASKQTTMRPDPEAGALVGAVSLSALTRVLQENLGTKREFALDLEQDRPIPINAAPALRRAWRGFATNPQGESAHLIDNLMVGLAPFTSYRASERADWASPPPYLAQATRYLRRHLSEPVSIAALGEAVGIGDRQLQLAFQAHLGCTAQEYLRDARLDRALAILRDSCGPSKPSVSEVAANVGIAHAGRFAQYFSRRFGVLPSELRA